MKHWEAVPIIRTLVKDFWKHTHYVINGPLRTQDEHGWALESKSKSSQSNQAWAGSQEHARGEDLLITLELACATGLAVDGLAHALGGRAGAGGVGGGVGVGRLVLERMVRRRRAGGWRPLVVELGVGGGVHGDSSQRDSAESLAPRIQVPQHPF